MSNHENEEPIPGFYDRLAKSVISGEFPIIHRDELEGPPRRWDPETMDELELVFKTRAIVAFLSDATADYNGRDINRLVYPYHQGISHVLSVVVDALDVIESGCVK